MDKTFMTSTHCIPLKLVYIVIYYVIVQLTVADISGSLHIRHVQYEVNENVADGYFIGDLLQDSKLHNEFHSDIIKSLFFKPLSDMPVNISLAQESGKLVVNGGLDREKICLKDFYCELNVDIAVQPQDYFRIIKVNIKVIDINDNCPTFVERRFYTTLPETSERGTIVQLPYAEDIDSVKYGVKGYVLTPKSNLFKLQIRDNVDDSQDVILVLDKELDFETQTTHNLTLIANDGGDPPKSGSIQISILVSDANDHIPYFVNTSYEISIKENSPIGTTLLRVKAVDKDSGLNSRITYRFSDRTEVLYGKYFTVNNGTGDIVVRDIIDYEKKDIFHLGVVARDMGQNSHPVDTTVIIRVLDQNDCSPEIDINTLNVHGRMGVAEVVEESRKSTFVAHISVKDRDSGLLGEVLCQINSPNFMLESISKNEYQINTNTVLDREVKDSYSVILSCADRGNVPKTTTKRLKVQVIDINDHSPKFSRQSYSGSVTENFFDGQVVLTANATDRDIGENAIIKYLIPHGEMRKYFSINQSTGVIKTLRKFDREEAKLYRFDIEAQDCGSPPKVTSAEVIVNILDVNDEKPIFSKPTFYLNISEDEPVGSLVGKIFAEDKDSVSNNKFTYRIIENSNDSFSIQPYTGLIKTKKNLDREAKELHKLKIQAEDHGRPPLNSQATVQIIVKDKNDNSPHIIFPNKRNNTVRIPALLPVNYAVSKIICRDPDKGKNGLVTYEMVTRGSKFTINNATGVLVTKTSINAVDGDIYEITFKVRDNGKPHRYTSQTSIKLIVDESLVLNQNLVQKSGGLLSGTNLRTVIVASAILAFIIISLIIIIACICCRRSRPPPKNEARYDKFQIREATVDNFHDSDTTHMAALHTSTHEYAKDNDLMDDSGLQLDDYDYPKLSREPMSYPVSYLMSKKANGHHNYHNYDYQKPLTCEYNSIQRSDQDQDSTYSGDGSNTDSGKGPSEEGDNTHLQTQGMTSSCNIPLAPVLEEDQRSNNDTMLYPSKYATSGRPKHNHCTDNTSSVQYGFHRTLPHTVISGIPKCKCRSCNMNRFKTGLSTKQKDVILPNNNGDHLHMHDVKDYPKSNLSGEGSYHATPSRTFKYDRPYVTSNTNYNNSPQQPTKHCETQFTSQGTITVCTPTKQSRNPGAQQQTYQPVDYLTNTTSLDPPQQEEQDGSSTTSGSYVVDHHDMSDVLNDSHWNIRDAVSKDSIV